MYTTLIDAAQLAASLNAPGWLIFDVRHDLADHGAGRRAYEEAHIPGAHYLDHESQLAAPKTGSNGRHPLPGLPEFARLMHSHGLAPDTQVVIYDASAGMFAAHLWWMLRWLGHEKVAVLDGGWPAWLAQGGAVEAGSGSVTSAQAPTPKAQGSVHAAMATVDADTVLANIHDKQFTVVDARAANRYRGEVEPMDPVAGHIPGAINRPNTLNVQENGRFKPAQQLHDEFLALLGDTPPSKVVHQCGSGITACHNLLAMEVAGLGGSALYPGSWSEWCSDPSRPVARGD